MGMHTWKKNGASVTAVGRGVCKTIQGHPLSLIHGSVRICPCLCFVVRKRSVKKTLSDG